MFRKSTFVLIVFVLLSNGSANGKLQNVSSNLPPGPALSDKAPQSMRQTFNINNWGFGKADRKLLTEMKYKIDSLYEKSCQKSTKGKLIFEQFQLATDVLLLGKIQVSTPNENVFWDIT